MSKKELAVFGGVIGAVILGPFGAIAGAAIGAALGGEGEKQEENKKTPIPSVPIESQTIEKFIKRNVIIYSTEDKALKLFSDIQNYVHKHIEREIRMFPVRDLSGNIVGGFDLASSYPRTDDEKQRYVDKTVGDIANNNIPIMNPETTVKDARAVLGNNSHGSQRAIVMQGNIVVGIISLIDLPDPYRGAMSHKEAFSLSSHNDDY